MSVSVLNDKTAFPVLLTGKAGTGKSFNIDLFIKANPDKVIIVLAPTGIAAMNVDGVTIHSFFKFPIEFDLEPSPIVYDSSLVNLIKQIDYLIIDEISMVRADLLDRIDLQLQFVLNNTRPFGNLKVILAGDLMQLNPVLENGLRNVYSLKYTGLSFFHSKVFNRIKDSLNVINLTKIYRQKNSKFIELLNQVRNGENISNVINTLNKYRVKLEDCIDKIINGNTIMLATTNLQVDTYNSLFLDTVIAINKVEHTIHTATFNISNSDYILPEPIVPKVLKLCKGAKVMLCANEYNGDDLEYCNGSLGTIENIYENFIDIKLFDKDKIVSVYQKDFHYYEYSFNEKIGLTKTIAATYTQYPIKLGYCITVHKSQGLTFNDLIVNTTKGFFADGQLYVALSRCAENLSIIGELKHEDVKCNLESIQFLKELNIEL
jgi:ATP-dependent DNA helicase PIF1